jgi:alpha-amylase
MINQKYRIGVKFIFFMLISSLTLPISFAEYPNYKINTEVIKMEIFHKNPTIFPNIQSNDPGNKVLIQGYFWEVPDQGFWWDVISDQANFLQDSGFDAIWLPPMVKTKEGNVARCGYEPYDYYDLGEFDQKGTIRTRYGTRSQIESMIDELHNNNISVIGDIVINHNNGGASEFNTFTSTDTNTDFMNISSGKFPRNYTHFYPNPIYGDHDRLAFGNFPDLIHENPYVHSELLKWANWLKDDIGFDGWRFDVALGIIPEMLRDWMVNVSGFGVAEYWTGTDMDLGGQLQYLDDTNNTLNGFDFILLEELHDMTVQDGLYDMQNLVDAGLLGVRPEQTWTFAVNHDTYRTTSHNIPHDQRLFAYLYILTHEGYPMIYWDDYYDLRLQQELKAMIKIHNLYANGDLSVLYADEDLYVMERGGDPGLLLVLNDNPDLEKNVEVTTKWNNVEIHDLLGRMPNLTVDESGKAIISANSFNYGVYSIENPIFKPKPYLDESKVVFKTEPEEIIIDGILDEIWPSPKAMDNIGDAGVGPQDLISLYMTTDETYLYLGFESNQYNWAGANLDYGIAIDSLPGGSREDPGKHPEIRYGGTPAPDFLIYCNTDVSKITHGLEHGEFYVFNGEGWDLNKTYVKNVDFASNIAYNFAELKIPLKDIALETGGNFSVKVFTSEEGKIGAADSVPSDAQVDGFGDSVSWLSLTDIYEILPISLDPGITSKILSFDFTIIFFSSIIGIIFILKKENRKKNGKKKILEF